MGWNIVAQALVFLLGTTAYAPTITLDDGLNTAKNGIKSCSIESRTDGPHLVIKIGEPHVGDQLQFVLKGDIDNYDYVFGRYRSNKFKLFSRKLESNREFDVPLKSAMGLRNHKLTKIFKRKGAYTLYIGSGFQSTEEPDLEGICKIMYDGDAAS